MPVYRYIIFPVLLSFLLFFPENHGMIVLAQTQMEMNVDACETYKDAEGIMEDTYLRILSEYQDDEVFIEKFKAAQSAWMVFRDAHLSALFPEEDTYAEYGSMYPLCRCNVLRKMTDYRVEMLKMWEDGAEEGDLCVGSVRLK
ncbi:lysozyme inhibitor LprI family protein [Desulfonatronum sp. SC1]|uniref:lysozyme inhibitor LprI family protein n=1 Tax=Desulfonatronum sp. SC1 TaxID=2109626 RepID=UPI001304E69F|nr:lysozyme inhibitor LprI family protein [Desulfonatronum sp. SC1]